MNVVRDDEEPQAPLAGPLSEPPPPPLPPLGAAQNSVVAEVVPADDGAIDAEPGPNNGSDFDNPFEMEDPDSDAAVAGSDVDIPSGMEGQDSDAAVAYVILHAHGFREAVRVLADGNDRRPIDRLSVCSDDFDDPRSFPRFVDLLGRHGGGRTVRKINFQTDWRGLPGGDMERLFGNVLPGHRTLESIHMNICHLPTECLQMLTDNFAVAAKGSSLSELRIRCVGALDDPGIRAQQAVEALVDMLNRNASIKKLGLAASFELDSDQCKLLCQALPRNSNLRRLELHVTEVSDADALDGVATSKLEWVRVTAGSMSVEAIASLARQLRTNETLWNLRLVQKDRRDLDRLAPPSLVELVRTYNYTIGSLGGRHCWWRGPAGEPLDAYMMRNARIRGVLRALQNSDPDAESESASRRVVVPPVLLPSLLGLVSDVPTVLNRILHMGYVSEVSDLLADYGDGRRRSLRRRRRHD